MEKCVASGEAVSRRQSSDKGDGSEDIHMLRFSLGWGRPWASYVSVMWPSRIIPELFLDAGGMFLVSGMEDASSEHSLRYTR
jgi:hypothetical protein